MSSVKRLCNQSWWNATRCFVMNCPQTSPLLNFFDLLVRLYRSVPRFVSAKCSMADGSWQFIFAPDVVVCKKIAQQPLVTSLISLPQWIKISGNLIELIFVAWNELLTQRFYSKNELFNSVLRVAEFLSVYLIVEWGTLETKNFMFSPI